VLYGHVFGAFHPTLAKERGTAKIAATPTHACSARRKHPHPCQVLTHVHPPTQSCSDTHIHTLVQPDANTNTYTHSPMRTPPPILAQPHKHKHTCPARPKHPHPHLLTHTHSSPHTQACLHNTHTHAPRHTLASSRGWRWGAGVHL
jgi:hypothetical protein